MFSNSKMHLHYLWSNWENEVEFSPHNFFYVPAMTWYSLLWEVMCSSKASCQKTEGNISNFLCWKGRQTGNKEMGCKNYFHICWVLSSNYVACTMIIKSFNHRYGIWANEDVGHLIMPGFPHLFMNKYGQCSTHLYLANIDTCS